MKKLYTIALASFVALTAAAGRPITPEMVSKVTVPNRTVEVKKADLKPASNFEAALMHKAPSRAEDEKATIDDFQGDFNWFYYTLMEQDEDGYPAEGGMTTEFVLVDAATGKIKINGMTHDYTIEGTIDLEKGTLTLPNNQFLEKDDQGDVYFYFQEITDDGIEVSDVESVEGTIEGTTIEFPAEIVFAFGSEDGGWWDLTFANEFQKGLQWVTIAEGKMLENITYYLCSRKDNTQFFTTQIQKCLDYEGIYRIIDPLKLSYAALGLKIKSPALLFDASNPQDVLISLTDTGLQSQTLGYILYFSSSYLYAMQEVSTPAEECVTLTNEGNKYKLLCPGESLKLFTTADQGFYIASDEPTTFEYTYDPAGVENVMVDANAPVEFFNLQGMRVANPSNGVYIRRQGNNVTKVKF